MNHSSNNTFEISNSILLPTAYGDFRDRVAIDNDKTEHLIVYKWDIEGQSKVPVRIHSECLTGDTFLSLRCDCE